MKMVLGPTTPMKSGKAQDFFLLSFSLLSRIRSSVYAVIVILILVRVLYWCYGMFGSFLPSVGCRMAHVLLICVCVRTVHVFTV